MIEWNGMGLFRIYELSEYTELWISGGEEGGWSEGYKKASLQW